MLFVQLYLFNEPTVSKYETISGTVRRTSMCIVQLGAHVQFCWFDRADTTFVGHILVRLHPVL